MAEKNQRCKCCKELGHSIANCPKDPNFRTTIATNNAQRVEEEQARLISIQTEKRLHANTIVQTTHFLKKCVIQIDKGDNQKEEAEPPAWFDVTGFVENGKDTDESDFTHPFKRGAMTFEDYNYA